jgi:hypothetical protein
MQVANPEVDALLEAAEVEPDEAKRRALWYQFQAIIHRNLPGIDLVAAGAQIVANKRVHDFALGPKVSTTASPISGSIPPSEPENGFRCAGLTWNLFIYPGGGPSGNDLQACNMVSAQRQATRCATSHDAGAARLTPRRH